MRQTSQLVPPISDGDDVVYTSRCATSAAAVTVAAAGPETNMFARHLRAVSAARPHHLIA